MDQKIIIGWNEWLSLPALHLPAIKAKIDTGAKISTLHAINIKETTSRGKPCISFTTHPLINDLTVERKACLPIIDRRNIISSNGKKEYRYIIETHLSILGRSINIEVSLTNRHMMRFPMLLGREAIKHFAIVDPSKSYCLGKQSLSSVKKIYWKTK